MKKLNIITLLCGLIIFITSCGGSTTAKSVDEGDNLILNFFIGIHVAFLIFYLLYKWLFSGKGFDGTISFFRAYLYFLVFMAYVTCFSAYMGNLYINFNGFFGIISYGAPLFLIIRFAWLLKTGAYVLNFKSTRYKCNSCQWTGTELKNYNYKKCPHCTSDNISIYR